MVSLDHNELICFCLSPVLIYKFVIDERESLENIKPALVRGMLWCHWAITSEAVLIKIKQYNINGNMLQYYSYFALVWVMAWCH